MDEKATTPSLLNASRSAVSENDVPMDKIADGLDPRPTWRRLLEQPPGDVCQTIGLAIAAAEQVDERVRGQLFDSVLASIGKGWIRQATVANDAVGRKTHGAGRRNDTAAPITKEIAIGCDRHQRAGSQEIGHDNVGCARKVRPQHHDGRRRLQELVQHFESDAIFIEIPSGGANLRGGYEPPECKPLTASFDKKVFACKKTIAIRCNCAQAWRMSEKSGCFARRNTAL